MAALAGTVQWFIRIIRKGQIYETLYNATTTDQEIVSNLHTALRDVYVAAIELLAKSDALFESGKIKQTLNALLRPQQAAGLISDLFNQEQKLSLEVQSCEASRNDYCFGQVNERLEGLKTQLAQLISPLTRVDSRVEVLLEKVEKIQLDELINFISSEMFGKSHATVSQSRIKQTGDWLINTESFQAWQDIPSSSTLLYLEGAGKSLRSSPFQLLFSLVVWMSYQR